MVDRLEKIEISKLGTKWRVAVLNKNGYGYKIYYKDDFVDACDYGWQLGRLYQLKVDIIK